MDEAVRRAIDAGRGVTGTLRVAFLGEWTAPVLLRAVALFGERHPDCRVEVHEAQLSDTRSGLLDGSTDVLIASYPFDGMATGPALLSEDRALAVAAGHPLTRERSVSLEVLADHPVVQYPTVTSTEFKRDRTPERTPAGQPVAEGTHREHLLRNAVPGRAGPGRTAGGRTHAALLPAPRRGVRAHPRRATDRTGPVWLPSNTTTRVREFVRAATDANPR